MTNEEKAKELYNPYKETVLAIAAMVEKYDPNSSDLRDFYNNVKVKCKDAIEFDRTYKNLEL